MLNAYLKELQRITILTPVEERALWHRYRIGNDVDSRLRLIESYQPLVFKVVMQIRPPDAVLMDMLQEGTVGLIEAVERFDHERGVRFSTFATYRIRGRVLNALRRNRPVDCSLEQEGQNDLSLSSRLADPESAAALVGVEDEVLAAQVRDAINGLPDRERTILQATYVQARAPRRVAAELRISLSHFYRLQKQAVAQMRRIMLDDVHQRRHIPGY